MTRRELLASLAVLPAFTQASNTFPSGKWSAFSRRLKPVGRTLEMPGYYVWCNSPIYGPDGRVHVFFSRWKAERKTDGWLNGSEIAHAVADSPESPFTYVDTVLAPRGAGFWDATTCYSPHVQYIDGKYCLFYTGNANGKTDTQRIGLATSDSLNGPWKRPDAHLLEPGRSGTWDDYCNTTPSFIRHPNGQYWLYYTSWSKSDNAKAPALGGNRKCGLAVASKLEGPYAKYWGNPVLNFSANRQSAQVDDAFVWREKDRFTLIACDMGVYSQDGGLFLESKDGLAWHRPKIAFGPVPDYVSEPPASSLLTQYGRLIRPQLLLRDNKPDYLFAASPGGLYMTSSAFVFKVL